jgi:hypothetical protein
MSIMSILFDILLLILRCQNDFRPSALHAGPEADLTAVAVTHRNGAKSFPEINGSILPVSLKASIVPRNGTLRVLITRLPAPYHGILTTSCTCFELTKWDNREMMLTLGYRI